MDAMDAIANQKEQENKRKGRTISITIHIGILLLALLPILTFPDPPPGQEGILVNLGLPDVGEGEENAPESSPPETVEETTEEEAVEEEVEEIEEPEPEPEKEVKKPDPVEEKKVIETEDPEALALKKKREKEKEETRKKEEERKKEEARKKAEAEKKRKEEEARKAAEAEKARKEAEAKKFKDLLSGGFGDGKGEGKGKTGTSGNQGDPDGDPDSKILEGISTGAGETGGGLAARGLVSSPRLSENSQKQGTIVLDVCVDASGRVISAEYTQRGSTTNDSQLKAAAIRNAKQWRFSSGNVDKQCGTITYRFKVK